MTTALLVALGAAVGAPARYLADRAIQSRVDGVVPWGTLTVNVAGSFVIGVLLGLAGGRGVAPEVMAGLGIGFCGALTTYSTFGYETVRLVASGSRLLAGANVALSVAAGLLSVGAGWLAGSGL